MDDFASSSIEECARMNRDLNSVPEGRLKVPRTLVLGLFDADRKSRRDD